MQEKTSSIRYDLVPPSLRDGTYRWIEYGITPGGFLTAIICNDLFMAWRLADDENHRRFAEIVGWWHEHAPEGSRGNETTFGWWKSQGGLQRTIAHARKENGE